MRKENVIHKVVDQFQVALANVALNSLYKIRNILSFFSFPGRITSVFMSLLLDISYLKRISM